MANIEKLTKENEELKKQLKSANKEIMKLTKKLYKVLTDSIEMQRTYLTEIENG